MKRLSLLLFAFAACSDPGGNPLGGGGIVPPGGGDDDDDAGTDAAVDGPDSGAPEPDAAAVDGIAGRMCRADSLLDPEACPSSADFTGVIAADVERGDFVQAAADGSFVLPAAPGATAITLRLAPTDPNYRRAIIPIGLRADGTAGPMKLPVMLDEAWVVLTNTIGSPDLPGDAAIVIYTVDGAAKLAGATVIGIDDGEVYYDNGAALEWDQAIDGTDADGVILITALSSILGTRTITLQQGARVESLVDIPIESDAITFVTADFGD